MRHGVLLTVPAAAWALTQWSRGDASDALLHTSWLLVIAAPLTGVARAASLRLQPRRGAAVVASLAVSVFVAVAVSAVLTLAGLGVQAAAFVASSHAVMAAVGLALAGFGALLGTVLEDELDAAAASLAVALLAGGGVLFAGTLTGVAPRPIVDGLLAASPFVAMASAANVDVLRLDLFYRISPLAHLGVEYPAWYAAGAGYAVIATVCCTGVCLYNRASRIASAV